MTRQSDLTTRQRAAIAALVTGATQEAAAEAVGVKARTLRRWQERPLFVAELRAAQDAALSDVTRELADGAKDMLTVLRAVAKDSSMPPHVRVRASLGWLGQLWRARELDELAARIATLEERMESEP